MITWKQWVDDASGGESVRQVASRINASPSSVSKWFRTNRPPVDAVVNVARVYHADMSVGFLSAGILNLSDLDRCVRGRLPFLPTHVLVEELARRGARTSEDLPHEAPDWESRV